MPAHAAPQRHLANRHAACTARFRVRQLRVAVLVALGTITYRYSLLFVVVVVVVVVGGRSSKKLKPRRFISDRGEI